MMSNSKLLPPLESMSPSNHGAAVVVTAYLLIVVTILFVTIRIATTYSLKGGPGLDHAFLVLASCFGLGETVTIVRAVDHGLGKHIGKLDAAQIDEYYKFSYASNILAIFSMSFAKLSTVMLVRRLSSAESSIYRIHFGVSIAIALWTVLSVFALAFQCESPQRWVYTPERCFNKGAVWFPITIFNIVSDAVIAFLFTPTLWKLHLSRTQRMSVIAPFNVRILVSVATIAQLVVLVPALHSRDQTRANVVPATLTQVVMNLSITMSAVPSLNRFLGELQTNRLGAQIQNTRYELSQDSVTKSRGFWKPTFKSTRSTRNESKIRSRIREDGRVISENFDANHGAEYRFRPDLVGESQVNVEHTVMDNRGETGSRTSDGSEKMIIKQTVGWEVHYVDGNHGDRGNGYRNDESHAR